MKTDDTADVDESKEQKVTASPSIGTSGSPYMQVWPEIVFGGQNLHIKANPTCIYHSDLHDIFLNSSMISFFY